MLNLVQNEVLLLSSNLDQFFEEKDELESQLLAVKHSLDQLVELPQEVEQIKDDVEFLKQQVADLRCDPVKSEEPTKHPVFWGALDRNEHFTGRKKILEILERAFDDNTTANSRGVPRRGVNIRGICGLGGCGKSSLALEYAWRNIERYPGGVFVVNGESDDLMRVSLQGIHEEFVNSTQSNKAKEGKSFEDLLTDTLSWLGNLTEKWLLLVDNLDQKKLSSCARKLFFGQWKSKTSSDILVTSRRRHQVLCEDLRLSPKTCYELDPFSVSESAEFLDKRTGIQSSCEDEDQEKKELAKELGGLPLALEQAAAYIKALECPIPLYLQQYCSQKAKLLSMKSAIPHTEIYNEERLRVQTTWLLNFHYITDCGEDQGLGRAAAFFMKIAAYLFPDDIPIDVLNVGAPEIEPYEDLKKGLEMPLGAQQVVDLLIKFSLFKRKSDDSLSIHRLVQETLRDRCDSEGETDNVLSSAIRMMHQAFLNCVGGTEFLRDWHDKMNSMEMEKLSRLETFVLNKHILAAVPLEGRRWRNLSKNAFHLVCNLVKDSSLKTCFFCEESARLFCEAALFCYSLGMDIQAYSLQQFVFEIICAVKEPIRYYKNDALLNVTRVLFPFEEGALISRKLRESADVKEETNDSTGASDGATRTDNLLKTIKVIEQRQEKPLARAIFKHPLSYTLRLLEYRI